MNFYHKIHKHFKVDIWLNFAVENSLILKLKQLDFQQTRTKLVCLTTHNIYID